MDWYGNRNHEKWIYRKVIWNPSGADHLQEASTYDNIVSGSLELSALSDAKACGQFSYYGGSAPENDSMLRVYYSFTDDNGEELEPVALATLFLAVDEPSFTYDNSLDELVPSGEFTGTSSLSVLLDKKIGYRLQVQAGINPIDRAVQIIESVGLRTNNPTAPSTVLSSNHIFESTDSYLTVVNWLLSNATPTYQAAYPDVYGNVMVTPYVPPEKREVVETFHDQGGSIMRPTVKERNDWQSNPNVARFDYVTEEESLKATAQLLSGAKWALDERGGREKTITETITELSGNSVQDRCAQLESAALNALVSNSNEIEHVQLEHGLLPWVMPNAAIAIKYANKSWSGNVMNVQISLSLATQCVTEIRRFITSDMVFTSSSEIIWQA